MFQQHSCFLNLWFYLRMACKIVISSVTHYTLIIKQSKEFLSYRVVIRLIRRTAINMFGSQSLHLWKEYFSPNFTRCKCSTFPGKIYLEKFYLQTLSMPAKVRSTRRNAPHCKKINNSKGFWTKTAFSPNYFDLNALDRSGKSPSGTIFRKLHAIIALKLCRNIVKNAGFKHSRKKNIY